MLIPPVNTICSLCLELKARKSIRKACASHGRTEVYGDMLMECFNISWPYDRYNDTICEVCITRLRNSILFKQKVLEALVKLDRLKEIVSIKTEHEVIVECDIKNIKPKIEPIKYYEEHDIQDGNTEQSDISIKHDVDIKMIDLNVVASSGGSGDLKHDKTVSSLTQVADSNRVQVIDSIEVKKIPYHKLPKVCKVRKKISLKDYVVVDSVTVPFRDNPAFSSLANCSESTSVSKIAKSSNVSNCAATQNVSNCAGTQNVSGCAGTPNVSNCAKSQSVSKSAKSRKTHPADSANRSRKSNEMMDKSRTVYTRLRLNPCLLLEHSTLLPFTFNKGYIECFFCKQQHVNFDELKQHTTKNHIINFDTVSKCIMRPNSKVRVDASNIKCKLCNEKFDKIELLTEHLVKKHNISFNDKTKPENCLLPYVLGDGKFVCYECGEEFTFFKTLSHHMNEHSKDNMCETCGQCFLLPQRLKVHVALHHETPKTVKCEICNRIFPHNIALRGHVRYTHKKISNLCLLCNIKFDNNELRLQHFQFVHNGVAVNRKCKVCCKVFTSLSGLNSHIRNSHPKNMGEFKYGCLECNMKFNSRYKLKEHCLVHTQYKKYECDVCHKRFGRAYTLKEHLKIHFNERRWSCRICKQTFVQKCSLKSHIRIHHGNCGLDETMVYIKT